MLKLREGIAELFKKAATSIPPDVEAALRSASAAVGQGPEAEGAVTKILEEIISARSRTSPVCQDIGIPVFYVRAPSGLSHKDIEKTVIEATRMATERVPLVASAVDPVTGENTGDNTGAGFPAIHIEESEGTSLTVELMLIGSRAERQGRSYSLPDDELKAGRDLEGVGKCLADAVIKAGGKACPPYILGVGVAASRQQAARLSKLQLLRKLQDENPVPALASMEAGLLEEINRLGIGPLGLGGGPTALGVKIGAFHCHTDCLVVDVSFSCWADRRAKLIW